MAENSWRLTKLLNKKYNRQKATALVFIRVVALLF
jgi:predicted nucleic acid-binding Zn ribbon protein